VRDPLAAEVPLIGCQRVPRPTRSRFRRCAYLRVGDVEQLLRTLGGPPVEANPHLSQPVGRPPGRRRGGGDHGLALRGGGGSVGPGSTRTSAELRSSVSPGRWDGTRHPARVLCDQVDDRPGDRRRLDRTWSSGPSDSAKAARSLVATRPTRRTSPSSCRRLREPGVDVERERPDACPPSSLTQGARQSLRMR